MRSNRLFLIGALCIPLTACDGAMSAATNDGTQVGPESLSAEVSAEPQPPNAPSNPSDVTNSEYYRVRLGNSGCTDGQCGGYYVRRVNRLVTPCADGVWRLECHVVDLDSSQLKLDEQSTAELRGQSNKFLLRGAIDGQSIFRISEAWRGHDGIVATGTYLRANFSGIECITYPCPTHRVERLNSDQEPKNVAGLRFGNIGAGGEDAQKLLATPEGVLVAAELTTETGPAGIAPALDATEYYLPFGR